MLHLLFKNRFFNCQSHVKSSFCTIALFIVTLFTSILLQPSAIALAATQIPTPQHVGNGTINAPNPSPQDIAITNERHQLSKEYIQVLHGKVLLATYEQHLAAFMQKNNLGNIENLHTVLTNGPRNKLQAANLSKNQNIIIPNLCPSVVVGNNLITPNGGCPSSTGAAQFPEEHSNYCSNATIATMLVEDSFVWGGPVLQHNGDNISYNRFVTSQPPSIALADETMLANNYLGNTWTPTAQNGAGPQAVLDTLNKFVVGHGGQYNTVFYGNVAGNFQNDLVTDINQGWDLAGGLYIYEGQATLNGYQGHGNFDHWIPITFYTNGGSTTYYADPIYNAPDYSGWAVPGPYTSTATSNLISILQRLGYIF